MIENKQSFLEEHSKPETFKNQVLENCSVPIGEDCAKICIEVFRGNCFRDFHRYFINKKWNKVKPVRQHEISFAGESGQDQGGVRRKFYSGMSYFYIFYMSLYCSFCLTLLRHVLCLCVCCLQLDFIVSVAVSQIYDGIQF